jgi:hypothetical protein
MLFAVAALMTATFVMMVVGKMIFKNPDVGARGPRVR